MNDKCYLQTILLGFYFFFRFSSVCSISPYNYHNRTTSRLASFFFVVVLLFIAASAIFKYEYKRNHFLSFPRAYVSVCGSLFFLSPSLCFGFWFVFV